MDRRQFFAEISSSALAMGGISLGGTTQVQASMKPTTWRVLHADVPNGNGRVYKRPVLENIVTTFYKENKESRSLFGTLGMTNDSIIHLSEVSHLIKDLKMDGDYMVAEIEVLNTPYGNILKKLISSSAVAFRTAGLSDYSIDDKGIYYISDNYKLLTINAVPIEEAAKI
jgi:hypothetical protein